MYALYCTQYSWGYDYWFVHDNSIRGEFRESSK